MGIPWTKNLLIASCPDRGPCPADPVACIALGIALYRDSARIDRAQVSAVFPQARSLAPRDSDFRVPDTRWHRLMKSGNPSIVVPYTPVILPRRHQG